MGKVYAGGLDEDGAELRVGNFLNYPLHLRGEFSGLRGQRGFPPLWSGRSEVGIDLETYAGYIFPLQVAVNSLPYQSAHLLKGREPVGVGKFHSQPPTLQFGGLAPSA